MTWMKDCIRNKSNFKREPKIINKDASQMVRISKVFQDLGKFGSFLPGCSVVTGWLVAVSTWLPPMAPTGVAPTAGCHR